MNRDKGTNNRLNQIKETQGLFIGMDIKWQEVKGHAFRVKRFVQLAIIERGGIKVFSKFKPYAYLYVDCPAFQNEDMIMPVLHKKDFAHFWGLYRDKGVNPNEEVIVSYVPETKGLKKYLGKNLPHLLIEVRAEGCLDKIYDLKGSESIDEISMASETASPIIAWDPEKGKYK